VRVLYAGEFEETQRSFDSLGQAFVIAILVMYMILGTQFGSYLQPVVILFSVPMALVGVVFGLLATGDPLTVPVLLGTVGLAGVAVNDAIVLVSFANDLRAQGVPPLEAARRAVPLRFRAVMLTTLTTVAGLVPSAVGFPGGRSIVWGPMATAFACGLVAATAFTLLATPALYLIALDLGRLAQGIRRRLGFGGHVDDRA
jgi:HAE1 family hydrophobic/amphiphilic exporter-1